MINFNLILLFTSYHEITLSDHMVTMQIMNYDNQLDGSESSSFFMFKIFLAEFCIVKICILGVWVRLNFSEASLWTHIWCYMHII